MRLSSSRTGVLSLQYDALQSVRTRTQRERTPADSRANAGIRQVSSAPLTSSGADFDFLEYPSTFPVEHRPVYIWDARPRVMVDHRMSYADERIWISRIDAIIRSRAAELDRSGIVHSVSYARAKRIMELSRFRDRMIWHDDSSGSTKAIAEFERQAGKGAVLVSPSVTMGVNFPDDICRWICVAKMPYPDMRSPIMQRRAKLDKRYAGYLMMKALVQSCGRGVRHMHDWCESIIVDSKALGYFKAYVEFAPSYFRQAVRTAIALPEPLEIAA